MLKNMIFAVALLKWQSQTTKTQQVSAQQYSQQQYSGLTSFLAMPLIVSPNPLQETKVLFFWLPVMKFLARKKYDKI